MEKKTDAQIANEEEQDELDQYFVKFDTEGNFLGLVNKNQPEVLLTYLPKSYVDSRTKLISNDQT